MYAKHSSRENSLLVCYSILRENLWKYFKIMPKIFTSTVYIWTGILIMLILRKRTKRFHCSFLWRKWFCCFFRVQTYLAKSVIYNLGSTGFFQNILFHIYIVDSTLSSPTIHGEIWITQISEVNSNTFQGNHKTLDSANGMKKEESLEQNHIFSKKLPVFKFTHLANLVSPERKSSDTLISLY